MSVEEWSVKSGISNHAIFVSAMNRVFPSFEHTGTVTASHKTI